MHIRTKIMGCAALMAIATASQAMAQAPVPAQGPDSTDAGQVDTSGDILVTARRTSEPLSKVPISVAAFSQERMDRLGLKDFTSIARQTPGVRITEPLNNISIRGIASSAGASTTGVYLDDTPIQIRTFGIGAANTLPAVFDLERVEVLRGPQGTLFGAGSEGGTVRFITPQPSLEKYSVYGRSELAFTEGGEPTYEAGVAVGGPIVQDVLGFRVSGWFRHEGGYVDAIDYHDGTTRDANSNWENTTQLRGALTWQPADGLLITPSITYQKRYSNNTDSYWEYYSDPSEGQFKNGNPMQLFDRDRYVMPVLKVEYDAGPVQIISNTSYFNRNQTRFYDASIYDLSYLQQQSDSFAPGVEGPFLLPSGPNWEAYGIYDYKSTGEITNRQRNWTQEVRLQSNTPDSPLTWVVGAFFQKNKQRNVEAMTSLQVGELYANVLDDCDFFTCWNGAPEGTGLLDGRYQWIGDTTITEKQYAIFGDATLTLFEKLKITAGARYAKNKFKFDSRSAYPGYDASSTGGTSEKPFTPKFNVSYQATPEHMVYGTVAKGYRIGGANAPLSPGCLNSIQSLGLPGLPESIRSDTVWSYEAGAKGRFGNAFRYDASVYQINWNDIQQRNYLQECGLAYTDNNGKAKVRGFDMQGSAKLTDFFTLEFALGYTDAKYTQNAYRSPAPDAPLAVQKGDALDGVSPWTVVIGGTSNFEIAGLAAYARFNYEYSSRQRDTPIQNANTSQYDSRLPVVPATHFVRVRAGTTLNGIDVSLFCDNLLNAHTRLTRSHSDRYTDLFTASTFRPRTVGLTATYRY